MALGDYVIYLIFGAVGIILLLLLVRWILVKMTGKIEIQLDKYNFSPGENVSGNIILKLKKPVRAKSLSVGLLAEKISTKVIFSSGGARSSNRTNTIFSFNQPLDGDNIYSAGEKSYPFKIMIPKEINAASNIGGTVGDVVQGIQALSNLGGYTRWYVDSRLDSFFNIRRRVQINLV